ncbi:MAG: ABC transporter permease [Actinobacteria bacterium]|nr:ABC transporter permease [Actinomycetota bacterium]
MTTPAVTPNRGRGANKRRALGSRALFLGPGLFYVTVFMAIPIALVISYAFLTRGRFGGVRLPLTLESFTRALDPVYLQVLGNSLLIATVTTVLALLIGYPVAYAIARMPSRWRTLALVLVVLPFWSNFLIRTYAWIVLLNSEGPLNKALIATGLRDEPIGLLYNRGAVIVGLLYAYLPLMILPLYASLERMDWSLLEAATNLGASRIRAFFDVTFPLTLPGAMIGAIFVFVPSLGNFIVPELLGGGKTAMVGNLIRDQFLKARDWPFGAVLALTMVAFLILLFALQAAVSRRINGPRAHA